MVGNMHEFIFSFADFLEMKLHLCKFDRLTGILFPPAFKFAIMNVGLFHLSLLWTLRLILDLVWDPDLHTGHHSVQLCH